MAAEFPVSAKIDSKDLDKLIKGLRAAGKEAGIAEDKLDEMERQARRTGNNGSKSINDINNSLNNLSTGFNKAGKAFLAFLAIDKLKQIAKDVLMTTAEFQKMEAVLTNTLGSNSKARLYLAEIADLAVKTPFAVTSLTESFIKLANRGVLPTMQQFTALGDLSATLGKDVSQLVEALLDINNQERWKEIGVRAQTVGDKVKLSFRGMTYEVDRTVQGVTNAAIALGQMEGVAGSMDAISKTLGGTFSNIGDNLDQLANNFGTFNKGPIAEFFGLIQVALTKMNEMLVMANKTPADIAEIPLKRFRDAFKEIEKMVKDPGFKGNFDDLNLFFQDLTIAINDASEELKDMESFMGVARSISSDYAKKKQLDIDILKAEIQGYRDIRKDVLKLVDDWKKLQNPLKEQLGLIEQLEAQIKRLEEAKKKAFTREEIARLNDELALLRTQLRIISSTDYTKDLVKTLPQLEKMFGIVRDDLDGTAKLQEDINKRFEKQMKDRADAYIDSERRRLEEAERLEREKEERRAAHLWASLELSDIIANEATIRQQIRYDNEFLQLRNLRDAELKLAGDNAAAKDKINKKFDKEERELRRKKAQSDRDQAVFNILLNTAQGVTAALASIPPNVPLSIAIGIIGGIEAGLARTRPLPKFAKGKYKIEGPGHATSDNIHAMLSPGESVVPAKASNKFGFLMKPIIENPDLQMKDLLALVQDNIPYQLRGNLFSQAKKSNNNEVLNELRGMRGDLSNLKQISIEVDEDGFQKWTHQGDQWTKHVDKRYSA